MTATTNVRGEAKARLAQLIGQYADERVEVVRGVPRTPANETIMIETVTGTIETPYMMAGRKRRKDTFTIKVGVWAGKHGQESPDVAERRCAELVGYVEDAVAEHATLDGLVHTATLGTIEGPDSSGTDEGWIAYALCDVQITAEMA